VLNSRSVVFFNYTTMQVTAKIVYYGPGLCGKTTNLQHIHHKTAPRSRGEMISLETETDRTLFFDLLPLDVGVIAGMKVRLQVYTVPGQVFYNATRKLVLKGVDGIVFVADSQPSMEESNIESLRNLEENLREQGLGLGDVPLVMQYNKRDIRQILSVEQMDQALNPLARQRFEAAALHGVGVFETLKAIARQALTAVRRRVQDVPQRAAAPVSALDRPLATAVTAPPVARALVADPLAQLVERPPAASEDERIEFAEEDTGKHVRPVTTKGLLDLHEELEKLRTVTSAPRASAPTPLRDVERRLADMLATDADVRQDFKRKAAVDVAAKLLKGSSIVRVHIGFDDGSEEIVRDVVTLKLAGNRRLERLTLHLDLELKSKS